MKKYLLAVLVAVAGVFSASAIEFGSSVSANILYASKFNQTGIGVNYKINLTDNFRVSPELQYFFSNDNMKTWDANVNLEYTFKLFEDCNVYPIVGFTYSHWTMEIPQVNYDKAVNTWDKIGGNIGAGIEYDVTSKIAIMAEVRGQIMEKYSQCVIGVGAKYRF